jgi:hypothetical protein
MLLSVWLGQQQMRYACDIVLMIIGGEGLWSSSHLVAGVGGLQQQCRQAHCSVQSTSCSAGTCHPLQTGTTCVRRLSKAMAQVTVMLAWRG